MSEVERMIDLLPISNKIIVEAGTPFVKQYGASGIAAIKQRWSRRLGQPGYIVADLKCMDRGSTEVEAAASAGATAATCLGLAPIETIAEFIKRCQNVGIDSMVDMMNVEFPFEVLQKLFPLPDIVVLHRGVDENELNKDRMIPLHLIHRIKGTYPIIISVAGCETLREVTSTVFNDADIAVVWKPFFNTPEQTAELARNFLQLVK